jgi:hypothetical protein
MKLDGNKMNTTQPINTYLNLCDELVIYECRK